MRTVTVFTDGATPRNGTSDATGGIGVFWEDGHADNVSECYNKAKLGRSVTNNIMELMAIRKAVDIFVRNHAYGDTHLVIYSDSMYCIKALTDWGKGWEKRGWKKKDGRAPENLDLIRGLYQDIGTRPITLKHCYSHGNPPPREDDESYKIWYGNHMADSLASSACR